MKGRFLGWLFFLGMIAGGGALQHLLNRPRTAQGQERTLSPAEAVREEQKKIVKDQLALLRADFERLSPEDRALVQELLPQNYSELVYNPMLDPFLYSPRRDPAAQAGFLMALEGRMTRAWELAKETLAWLLWGTALFVCGHCIFGFALQKPGLSERASAVALGFCKALFAGVGVLSVIVFSLTMSNPWPGLPYTFHCVPIFLLGVGVYIRIASRREFSTVECLSDILLIPATACALMFCLGFAAR